MAEPNRIAAALEYLGKLRRQIANTQGVAVPDDYGQRFGAPGEPVPSLNQVGQSVRGAAQRMTSLDAPASQGMGDTALDIAAGFTPLQYPQAARDFERSRRTGDKLGMGLATLAAVPVVGGVAKAAGGLRKFAPHEQPIVKAGEMVDGLLVRKDIPNIGSIAASFDDYEVLPGVRSIPISDFDPDYLNSISMDKLDARTRKLADEIGQSKELNPLIVAYDDKGAYIVEGGHRFDALIARKAKRLPAMVVIDKSGGNQ
jgi:hypothetical protein